MAALRNAVASLPDFSTLGNVDNIACGGARLPAGTTSATVHRFVRYVGRDGDGSDGVGRLPGVQCDVQFAAHTDGTWFTVIPCAEQP